MIAQELTDSKLIDEALRLALHGAAVFVQTIPGELHFLLFGRGFEVRITPTRSATDYSGKPA